LIKEIEAIIFDLGNTLLYFDGDIDEIRKLAAEALLKSLRCSGLNLPDDFADNYLEMLSFYHQKREIDHVEFPARVILNEFVLEWTNIQLTEDVISKALEEHYLISQRYWKNVRDLKYILDSLKMWNYKLGIISNASDDADVQVLVDNAGIRDYFDFVLTSAAIGVRKPDPIVFQKVLNQWNLSGKQVAMVGDTITADIVGANRLGMQSIWVTEHADTTFGSINDQSLKPDFIISELVELLEIFQK
jgi:HAD superfamily hydrolase (TIGR01549 family)